MILDLDGTCGRACWPRPGAVRLDAGDQRPRLLHRPVYFGLHEALKALKARGILLACVSKNDEAPVRELWTYPDHYPRERLLTPDDFVTLRIGWGDKPTSLRAIAAELSFATSTIVFIDDNAREREQVRAELPDVEVWGEDLYGLRRRLLDDPRLQRPRITAEAAARGELREGAAFARAAARRRRRTRRRSAPRSMLCARCSRRGPRTCRASSSCLRAPPNSTPPAPSSAPPS